MKNQKIHSKRIEYLDALKGISILLVVFCHYPMLSETSLVGNSIMSFAWAAVPCFMMVTGGLMHNAGSFSCKKHIRRVLTAYFSISAWKMIYLIAYMMVSEINVSTMNVINYLFFFGKIEGINADVMWYMQAYLIVMLLYPVTYFLFIKEHRGEEQRTEEKRHSLYFYVMMLAFVSGILLPSLNWLVGTILERSGTEKLNILGFNSIMPISQYANMVFYFMLGGVLFRHYRDSSEKNELSDNNLRVVDLRYTKVAILCAVVLIGIIGLMVIKKIDTGTFRWGGIYLSSGYNHLLTVVMSVALYRLFASIPDNAWFRFIGKVWGQTTMGIYYMHYLMLGIFNSVILPQLNIPKMTLTNTLKTLIVTTICSGITIIARKIPLLRRIS